MMPQSHRFLERQLATSCTDLFSSYGVMVDRRATSPEDKIANLDQSSGGIMRFAGDTLSGSLLVVGSFKFLAECRPPSLRAKALAVSSVTDWMFVRDWSMELANQLLGRIRNRLYAYGVTLDVRAPTAVSGHPLSVSIRGRATEPVRFVTKSGDAVMVWLDVVASPEFDEVVMRKPAPAPSPDVPKEGDVLVF
jgi:hypothetical protein